MSNSRTVTTGVTTTTTTTTTGNRPTRTITTTSQPTTTTTGNNVPSSGTIMSNQPQQQRDPPVAMSDHPKQPEMGHGYGEDLTQHMQHSSTEPVDHWGLSTKYEELLFYCFAILSWGLNIAAGVLGSYYDTSNHVFIICASLFQAFSWAAWWQTATQMLQRASWVRDEGNLPDRRRFLHLAVRLQRLMLPTAFISFCVFIVAYVRRNDTGDLANWLLFQIVFIFNIVASVMNAYNNITWESDRLEYEEGSSPYGNILLAILGIPTEPKKSSDYHEE